jgi:hypothetical protein
MMSGAEWKKNKNKKYHRVIVDKMGQQGIAGYILNGMSKLLSNPFLV